MRTQAQNSSTAARRVTRDDDVSAPPTPIGVLTRLGVLLVITLGIGLAAQAITGFVN